MTGRLARGFCTAAVAAGTLVATGTAVAVPAGAPMSPGPAPGPAAGNQHVRDTAGRSRAHRHPADHPRTAGPAGLHGAPAAARTSRAGQRSVTALLTDLQRLYRQAERATEAYRAAQRRLERQRHAVGGIDRRLARARRALHDSRSTAGRLARMQYQGSGDISPYVRLLLAPDPQHVLDQGHMLERVSAARASAVDRMAGDERRARALAATARRALDEQEALAERHRRQRDTVQGRLKAVERVLVSLGGDRPSQGLHRTLPAPSSRAESLVTRALHGLRLPSRGGAEAIRYAVRQIGKPYRWGAVGPDAFDCSGLTSQAWAHAGRTIPRTSQAQWAQLTHVPMAGLRPGDLVVYYPTATHVALYLGNGMVVQAPRPGDRVKVSPVNGNPVLGAVRPDPDEGPSTAGES